MLHESQVGVYVERQFIPLFFGAVVGNLVHDTSPDTVALAAALCITLKAMEPANGVGQKVTRTYGLSTELLVFCHQSPLIYIIILLLLRCRSR